MTRVLWVLAVLSVAGLPLQADSEAVFKAPTTPEQRLRVAAEIHKLEATPLNDDTKVPRVAIFQWVVESPDIQLKWCADILVDVSKEQEDRWGGLLVQAILSAAAFVIENPSEEKNDLLVARAGVRGALQTYQATLAAQPQPRSAFFDSLVAADAAGKLDDYIAPKVSACK